MPKLYYFINRQQVRAMEETVEDGSTVTYEEMEQFLHQVLANATAMMRNHEGGCVSGRINILMDQICSIEHENWQMCPFPALPLVFSEVQICITYIYPSLIILPISLDRYKV
jgi:hypothetical protein